MLYGKILYHSKVGYLTILSDAYYIRKIQFGKQLLPEEVVISNDHPLLMQAETQIQEYFDGMRKQFSLPLMVSGTPFQKAVWDALQQIPYGSVQTYGELARQLNNANAARAVGGACNKNPIVIVIPCHRIIGSNGSLTGFAGGLELKKVLLEHEKSCRQIK